MSFCVGGRQFFVTVKTGCDITKFDGMLLVDRTSKCNGNLSMLTIVLSKLTNQVVFSKK